MRRRAIIGLLGAAASAPPRAVTAQTGRAHRIGLLHGGAAVGDDTEDASALIGAMARRGHVLGRNLSFERRAAMAHPERLPGFARELAAAKVDGVVTWGYPAALAAKEAGVPTVATGLGDPVATGLIRSLARPGGTVTGISDVVTDLSVKRLELVKEVVPRLRRVAMLWNKGDLGMTRRYEASASVAERLGVGVQALGVQEPDDFGDAFAAMEREMPDAILMVADPLTTLNRRRVFEFAARHRLAAIYEFDALVRDGGLMSYGTDRGEVFERAAALLDHILRGDSPADLAFELPTRFRFAVNLRTARAIGLEFPPATLARADEVIE